VPVPRRFLFLLGCNTTFPFPEPSKTHFCLLLSGISISQLSCLRNDVMLDARGQPACLHTASLHLSAGIQLSPVIRQVTCTRLGSGRATSHVSMIVFAIPLSGDFLVVSPVGKGCFNARYPPSRDLQQQSKVCIQTFALLYIAAFLCIPCALVP